MVIHHAHDIRSSVPCMHTARASTVYDGGLTTAAVSCECLSSIKSLNSSVPYTRVFRRLRVYSVQHYFEGRRPPGKL